MLESDFRVESPLTRGSSDAATSTRLDLGRVLRVKKVGRVRKILLLAKGTAKTTDLFGALGKDHPFRIPTPWTLAGTQIRLLDSRRDNCEPCTNTLQESERDGRASGVRGIGSHGCISSSKGSCFRTVGVETEVSYAAAAAAVAVAAVAPAADGNGSTAPSRLPLPT
ncbi:hypothetical protein V1478_000839 [Vespula squamosa]|uniref:Uncharacterized protein n=1 Tax=Vespula squamosa TaxID=30214 RepID=A0ABD2C6M1_VESSQ